MLEGAKVEGRSPFPVFKRGFAHRWSRIEAISRDVRVMAVGKYTFSSPSYLNVKRLITKQEVAAKKS